MSAGTPSAATPAADYLIALLRRSRDGLEQAAATLSAQLAETQQKLAESEKARTEIAGKLAELTATKAATKLKDVKNG